MSKQKFISYLLPVIIWTAFVSILHYNWYYNLIWLWLGSIVGSLLLQTDHLVYLIWQRPNELTSVRFKSLWQQKRYKEAFLMVIQTVPERTRLSFHNVLFQVVFIPFSLLVLTSTGNQFGVGMVMSLFLCLLVEQITLVLNNRYQELTTRFFWPVQKQFTIETQKWYVVIMVFVFVLLNYFLL